MLTETTRPSLAHWNLPGSHPLFCLLVLCSLNPGGPVPPGWMPAIGYKPLYVRDDMTGPELFPAARVGFMSTVP